MTDYEKFCSMFKEELARWISDNCGWEETPWCKWFNENYCQKCEPLKVNLEFDGCTNIHEASYCEVNGTCRYFPNKEEFTDKNIILLWLENI